MSATAFVGTSGSELARASGAGGGGSASSPISIASSSRASTPDRLGDDSIVELSGLPGPSTPPRSRPRGVPAPGSPSPSPQRAPAGRALHPFFVRPRVPVPRQPRLVATYASTSSSFSSSAVDSQGTQTSFFSSSAEWYSAASDVGSQGERAGAAGECRTGGGSQTSQRSAGDVVPPPHGRRAFRPSGDISDLTEELGRLDVRASPERRGTAGTGEHRTADTGSRKADTGSRAAGWPILGPPQPAKGGYAAVAKTGVSSVIAEKPTPAAGPSSASGPAPASAPAAGPSTPASAPAAGTSALPLFSHKDPIPGHFTRAPSVAYTTDPAEVEDLLGCLSGPLALDLEWPPPGQGAAVLRRLKDGSAVHVRRPVWDGVRRKNVWPEAPATIVQISDARLVIVFQMLHAPDVHVRCRTNGRSEPMPHSMPPALLALLADPGRIKAGVNVRGDGLKLWRDFRVPSAGLLELSALARAVDAPRWGPGGASQLVGMARLAAHYLGRRLDKGDVRTGDWGARRLAPAQVAYAADDAFAGRLLYDALLRRARETGTKLDVLAMASSVGDTAPMPPKAVPRPAAPSKPAVEKKPQRPAVPQVTPALGAWADTVAPRRKAGVGLYPSTSPPSPKPPPQQAPSSPPAQLKVSPQAGKPAASTPSEPPPPPNPQAEREPKPQPQPKTHAQAQARPQPPAKAQPAAKPDSGAGLVTAFRLFQTGHSVSEISARFRLHVRATQALVLDGASRSSELDGALKARLRDEIGEKDRVWGNYVVLKMLVWGSEAPLDWE